MWPLIGKWNTTWRRRTIRRMRGSRHREPRQHGQVARARAVAVLEPVRRRRSGCSRAPSRARAGSSSRRSAARSPPGARPARSPRRCPTRSAARSAASRAAPACRAAAGPRRSPSSSAPPCVIRTGSFGWLRSTVSSAVMIFVRLAIGSTSVGRSRHSTSPVSTSNTSPARGGRRRWMWNASTPESGDGRRGLALDQRRGFAGRLRRGRRGRRAHRQRHGGGAVALVAGRTSRYAAAATPNGAARIARTAISRPARDRRRPPCRTGAGDRRRPQARRRLAIGRRWRRQGAQHAYAEQREHDHRDDHEDVDPVLRPRPRSSGRRAGR